MKPVTGLLLAAVVALALAGGALALLTGGGGDTDGGPEAGTPRRGSRTPGGAAASDGDPQPAPRGAQPPSPAPKRRPPDPGRDPDMPDPPVPGAGLRIADRRWSAVQDRADWRRVGVAIRRQILAARGVAHAYRNGREPEREWKEYGDALVVAQGETMPGLEDQMMLGSFVPTADGTLHPGIFPNAIAAALDAFHRPMTDAQADAVAAAAKTYSDVWEDRPQGEWRLVRMLRVAEACETFRAAAAAALDENQRLLLWPEETAARYRLDALSPAAMLGERPLPFDGTAESLSLRVADMAMGAFERPDMTLRSTLSSRAAAGLAASGAAVPPARTDLLARRGHPTWADLRLGAAAAIAAARGIADHEETPKEAARRLGEVVLMVPQAFSPGR